MKENNLRASCLFDPAFVNDGDAVCDLLGAEKVVNDEDSRNLQPPQQDPQFCP